jgi:hypothetical protein
MCVQEEERIYEVLTLLFRKKINKCNHVHQLKHENKVPRNTMAIKTFISSAIRRTWGI